MKVTFRQSADGAMKCRVRRGTPHCGPNDGPQDWKWFVSVEWQGNPLDGNGMLVDNLTFKAEMAQFFRDLNGCQFAISCEKLAELFARQISAFWESHHFGPNPATVLVRLSPFEGVAVEALCSSKEASCAIHSVAGVSA